MNWPKFGIKSQKREQKWKEERWYKSLKAQIRSSSSGYKPRDNSNKWRLSAPACDLGRGRVTVPPQTSTWTPLSLPWTQNPHSHLVASHSFSSSRREQPEAGGQHGKHTAKSWERIQSLKYRLEQWAWMRIHTTETLCGWCIHKGCIWSGKKKQHLQVFRKQLFIQREALDDPLVACMESPQLQPLIGRVSVGGTRREKKTVRRMFVRLQFSQQGGDKCQASTGLSA